MLPHPLPRQLHRLQEAQARPAPTGSLVRVLDTILAPGRPRLQAYDPCQTRRRTSSKLRVWRCAAVGGSGARAGVGSYGPERALIFQGKPRPPRLARRCARVWLARALPHRSQGTEGGRGAVGGSGARRAVGGSLRAARSLGAPARSPLPEHAFCRSKPGCLLREPGDHAGLSMAAANLPNMARALAPPLAPQSETATEAQRS